MKLHTGILCLLLFCSFVSVAQPRYSSGVRADRETQWMLDSLHISPNLSDKVHGISLTYNQEMDKASMLPEKEKNKKQRRLMNKKDADVKALLNKEQYQKYCKREKMIRDREKIHYTGKYRPL